MTVIPGQQPELTRFHIGPYTSGHRKAVSYPCRVFQLDENGCDHQEEDRMKSL